MATIEERAKTHIIRSFTDMNDFQAGYYIGATEMLDKACEWLCENIGEYARLGEDGAWIEHSVVKDFRKTME